MSQEKPKADPAKFIVWNEEYSQHPGYAPWLAGGLDKLYENPPKTAKDLVEQSASYMQPYDPKMPYKYRSSGQQHQEPYDPAQKKRWIALKRKIDKEFGKKSEVFTFGPIIQENYGNLDRGGKNLHEHASIRGYYRTIARNYPEKAKEDGDCSRFGWLQFSYPVPGKGRMLKLMDVMNTQMGFPGKGNPSHIIITHPTMEHYDDFILCLDPLFAEIRSPETSAEQKKDAVITFYWLMSQMTPTTKGGSAHARMVLEYLATEAGFEVPHMKKGYDLWAEAATVTLERFREGFRSGRFFDPEVTSAQILEWQRDHIKTQDMSKTNRSSSSEHSM